MNVLITGATSGIGNALAKELAKKGHIIYACCHTVEELKRVRMNSEQNIQYIKLDITKEQDYAIIPSLNIDVLVNQAGLGIGGSLLDLEMSKIEENFEVNVFATLRLSKFYIEDCYQKERKGRILITSSLAGYLPIPFMGSYTATKSSLIMLAKVLQKELSLSNVDVSVKLILPGAYHTGFNQYMMSFIDKSKYFSNLQKNLIVLQNIFLILEKKNTHSIVRQMMKAVISDKSSHRMIYSAPQVQRIFTRIYRIFSK